MIEKNTLVLTPDGYTKAKNKPSEVWNGEEFVNPFWERTLDRIAYRIEASNGLNVVVNSFTNIFLEDDYKEAMYISYGETLQRFKCPQVHTNQVIFSDTEIPLNTSKASKQGYLARRINKEGSYALKDENPFDLILMLHTLGVYPSVSGKYIIRIPPSCLEAEKSTITVPPLSEIKTEVTVSKVEKLSRHSLLGFTGLIVANGILVGNDYDS